MPIPLILAGISYRCGSSLVQRLLNSTNECFIFGEDNASSNLIYNLTGEVSKSEVQSIPQEQDFLVDRNCWHANLGITVKNAAKAIKAYYNTRFFKNRTYINGLGLDYNNLKYVGFKFLFPPAQVLLELQKLFPDMQIIYMYRNFVDVCKSYYRMKWAQYDLGQLFTLYYRGVQLLQNPINNMTIINYDKLTLNILREMLSHFGLTEPTNYDEIVNTSIVCGPNHLSDQNHDNFFDYHFQRFMIGTQYAQNSATKNVSQV